MILVLSLITRSIGHCITTPRGTHCFGKRIDFYDGASEGTSEEIIEERADDTYSPLYWENYTMQV